MKPYVVPRSLWVGLAFIVASSLVHLGLEVDRAMRIEPQLSQGPQRIEHTYQVITAAHALRQALHDAERGQRGFLLTEEPAYLEAYRKGVADAPAQIEQLKRLTSDNPEQQRRWPSLAHQVDLKLAELQSTIDAHDREGAEAARAIVRTNAGLDAMQAIDGLLDAAIEAEYELLNRRMSAALEYEHSALARAWWGAMLSLAVLAVGALIVFLAFRRMVQLDTARTQSEERFRHLVEGVTDYAIYMLDAEGRVVAWNPGAERVKGYRADEILGRSFSVFYTESDRQRGRPERALELAGKNGKYEEEAWRVRKDGKQFLASVLINALRDPHGKLLGFAKVTRDVTELRRHQEALAQYQKMDALGQLTGGIAHDFNNLLHVIKNASQALERRLADADPTVRKFLEMLSRNTDRASSLTQRLLAFSRRQLLDPKPINPNGLIQDVSNLLKQALGEGIELETVVGAGIWWISADQSQLEIAVLNLALNARDAMAGKGKLTIEMSNAFIDERYAAMQPDVKPGQYVMIAVSDTGAGMSEEVRAKAFDPFFTTKEVGRGTGLGLSQVYGFAKQSGGHVRIYSEVGQGTTVKLYLPRFVGSPEEQREAKPAAAPASSGGATVLVVEDDGDVRQFTAEILDELGYRVVTANDAAAALELLGSEPRVDLLFTDVGLPGGMNGKELATEALRRDPKLKVLYTTGYTRNAIMHHGRLDPGVEVIVKPFTQLSLAKKIRDVLSERPPRPA